jgi:uracil phosphoribosyltransferase
MLTEYSDDPMVRLLVNETRRRDVAGPALARAHRAVGAALAKTIAGYLPLEDVAIEHVAGPSTGVRIRPGKEPIVLAIMRGGLFLAEGIWGCLPGSALVTHQGPGSPELPASAPDRLLVLVDSVINTGSSIRKVVRDLGGNRLEKVLVAALVGYRPTVETLVRELREVDFIVARLSDRSYVGKGPTDTGARLFGTTGWSHETKS